MNSIDIIDYNSKVKLRKNRDINSNVDKTNRHRRSNSSRRSDGSSKDEASAIRLKFPSKIPIIVERYHKEKELPHLDKRKFLVPQEITFSQFISIIRNRMQIGPSKALFLLVNERSMVTLSRTMAEIYASYKNLDGFLHITYASQEVFG